MTDPCAPSRVVAVQGETLELYDPAQADRFLGFVTSYQAAERLQLQSEFLLAQRIVSAASSPDYDDDGEDPVALLIDQVDDERDPGQRGPCPGHVWVYTGTAYGGDDESFHGEGRVYCENCGADGDA